MRVLGERIICRAIGRAVVYRARFWNIKRGDVSECWKWYAEGICAAYGASAGASDLDLEFDNPPGISDIVQRATRRDRCAELHDSQCDLGGPGKIQMRSITLRRLSVIMSTE